MRHAGPIALCLMVCLVRTMTAQDAAALNATFVQASQREKQNMAEAVRLYDDAARQGHTPSMVRLGYLRQSGAPGVAQDLPGALALFAKAANEGNLDGQFMLALSYAQGIGTAKDAVAARKWLLQPAAAGYQFAQYALGIMLEAGEGGEKKVAAARRWLDRAAAGPDRGIAAKAADLRGKVDKELFAVDNSGTVLVGLLLFMAVLGDAIPGGGGGSSAADSGQMGRSSGGASTPRPVRCHPEPINGPPMTLHGVTSPVNTRMVCD